MKKIVILLFLSFGLSSCFLFSKYRKTTFNYSHEGQSYSLPLLVPKGYTKEKSGTDSAGNTLLEYYYGGKTFFYAAYLADTAISVQPIIKEDNMPQLNIKGAVIYKGIDANDLFWREVRKKNIRVGYRYVPQLVEGRFDSATNFAAVQVVK